MVTPDPTLTDEHPDCPYGPNCNRLCGWSLTDEEAQDARNGLADPTLTDEELAEIRDKTQHRPTCLAQPWRTGIECSCGAWERIDRLIAALGASRQREVDAVKGYPDDLSTVPPNERAAILLSNVRARGDEYGDVANSFGDLLRDALVLAAKELNEADVALMASREEVERLREAMAADARERADQDWL